MIAHAHPVPPLPTRLAALALGLGVQVGGCVDAVDGGDAERGASLGTGSPDATTSSLEEAFVLPPERPHDPNPLDLPPAPMPEGLDVGRRIFTVPLEMLETLAPGRVLELRAAYYRGLGDGTMLVRVGHGPTYPIHPAYVVVPERRGRLGRGTRVIASYRGRLHHGVVSGRRARRILVQFTDLGTSLGLQRLDPERVGSLGPGLRPGGFATRTTPEGLEHLTLVSAAVHPDGVRRWLTVGHHGTIDLVPETSLTSLPREGRPRLRPGDPVRVVWRGRMVPGTLRAWDRLGLYTVQRTRSGAPLVVGPGMIMPE
ncbi:MAG: hypothetical protein AAF928_11220 [Myxococcota bacterium]